MPIVRRVTAERTEKRGRLRHPLLAFGTNTLLVYNFVKANPDSRTSQAAHLTASRQPFTNLVREGLLVITNEKKPYTYRVVPENETGKARDKVEVQITVFANKFGEYSIKAKMVGQRTTAHEDFPQEVAGYMATIPIPYPDDPYATRPMIDINDRAGGDIPQEAIAVYTKELLIEGDFTIIDP